MKASETIVQQMTEIIIREMDPRLILMFGSQARGEATEDSDLDLIIVQDRDTIQQKGRRQQIGRLHRELSVFMIPIDLLLYSPEEFEVRKGWRNHVIADAVQEGRVLYERN